MSDTPIKFKSRAFTGWVQVDITDFSAKEIGLLHRFGCWYQDLQDGVVPAVSDAQKRFVECAHGKVEPLSRHEIAWRKYLTAFQLRLERLKHTAAKIRENELEGLQKNTRFVTPQWGSDSHARGGDYYEEIIYPYMDEG
jgi:uncharacterized protein YifE (UPF0438 family)